VTSKTGPVRRLLHDKSPPGPAGSKREVLRGGEAQRTRTSNRLIKSQLLYLLS
jgi:hypothetical protein